MASSPCNQWCPDYHLHYSICNIASLLGSSPSKSNFPMPSSWTHPFNLATNGALMTTSIISFATLLTFWIHSLSNQTLQCYLMSSYPLKLIACISLSPLEGSIFPRIAVHWFIIWKNSFNFSLPYSDLQPLTNSKVSHHWRRKGCHMFLIFNNPIWPVFINMAISLVLTDLIHKCQFEFQDRTCSVLRGSMYVWKPCSGCDHIFYPSSN